MSTPPSSWPLTDAFPCIVTMNVGSNDEWLRIMIRGEHRPEDIPPAVKTQSVIVQDAREADRILAEMNNLKVKRLKPYGGGWIQAWFK